MSKDKGASSFQGAFLINLARGLYDPPAEDIAIFLFSITGMQGIAYEGSQMRCMISTGVDIYYSPHTPQEILRYINRLMADREELGKMVNLNKIKLF